MNINGQDVPPKLGGDSPRGVEPSRMRTKKLKLLIVALLGCAGFVLCGCDSDSVADLTEARLAGFTPEPAPVLGFRVVNTFPHQTDAFTQGLLFENGNLYESTGLLGESSLRKVDLTTGQVLQQVNLPANVFGEGLASRAGTLVQLTLDSGQAFLWDQTGFTQTGTATIPIPAWGITYTNLSFFAFSDGSSTIRYLNPETFEVVKEIVVTDNGMEVDLLNELEYINGLVYANRFTTDEIVAFNPFTGIVQFRIDLSGIIDKAANGLGANDVLNGIAYDSASNRLFVTGKRWPFLFQIELVQ